MAGVFDKLQLKDQKEIVVLNAPASFEPELAKLKGVSVARSVKDAEEIAFSIAFVMTQPEVEAAVKGVAAKQSSKRYTSTIHRDSGWDSLGKAGFEAVRMVAIDEDWSALRFRRAGFIKSMKRDSEWAMTKVGKAKTKANANVRKKA